MSAKPIRFFAWFTIAQASFHFAFETYGHFLTGQSLPSLMADYLAVGLPLLGAIGMLRWNWGPGVLCGGWGFEFCLYYRAWVWRVDTFMRGEAEPFMVESIEFLSFLLATAAVAFVISAYVCIAHNRSPASPGGVPKWLIWVVGLVTGVLAGVAVRLAVKLVMALPAGDGGPLSLLLVVAAIVWAASVVSLSRSSQTSSAGSTG